MEIIKNYRKSIPIILILLLIPIFTWAIDRTDYDNALAKYKNNEFEMSLSLFEKFRNEFPDSIKADDSLWYMGRIYKKLDRITEAEDAFNAILEDKTSNRYEEAAYEIGKIYYYRGEYRKVLEVLSFIDEIESKALNSYHLKGSMYRAKAWYRLAYREKLNYNDIDSVDMFQRSLKIYSDLESLIDDEADLNKLYFDMARTYFHLADLSHDASTYKLYMENSYNLTQKSLPFISEADRHIAGKMILDLEKSKKIGFKGQIIAYGGADSLSANTIGADIYARGSLVFPTNGRSGLELDATFKHSNFDFVASNFDKTKTGDTRLVQYAKNIGVDLSLRSGTIRNVYNKLNLFGDFQFAEDTRDNYTGAGISDNGSIRFNKNWKFLWDSKFEWRTYPNYLIGGKKLDYLRGSLDPQIKLYALDWLNISFLYNIDIKQYLESKYDTIDPAVPSTLNKMNLTNRGELLFDFQAGKIYNPTLLYRFAYLKTFNYDYWVSGLPANRFIEGYYDNISHNISFDNTFDFNEKFKVFLGSSLILTNFLNYPARDDTKTFIDELRNDISLKLDLGVNYIFWTSPGGTEFEARLRGWWDYKVSNMTYNTTFDTNYSFAGAMLGLSVKLP